MKLISQTPIDPNKKEWQVGFAHFYNCLRERVPEIPNYIQIETITPNQVNETDTDLIYHIRMCPLPVPYDELEDYLSNILHDIPEMISRKIQQGDIKLLFDNYFESVTEISIYVCKALAKFSFPTETVFLVTSDTKEYNTKYYTHVHIPMFEALAKSNIPRYKYLEEVDNTTIDKRRFMCFNNLARNHRLATVSYIAGSGLLGKGHTSLLGEPFRDLNSGVNAFIDAHFDEGDEILEILRRGMDQLNDNLPLEVDVPKSDVSNSMHLLNENQQSSYYDKVDFALITETFFETENIFPTEKIYKPFYNKKFFVALAPCGFLSALRDSGFKTFHPTIDESYDHITDPARRFSRAMELVTRLANMTDVEMTDIHERLAEVYEHNYRQMTMDGALSRNEFNGIMDINKHLGKL